MNKLLAYDIISSEKFDMHAVRESISLKFNKLRPNTVEALIVENPKQILIMYNGEQKHPAYFTTDTKQSTKLMLKFNKRDSQLEV